MNEQPLEEYYYQPTLTVGKTQTYLVILYNETDDEKFHKEYHGENFHLRPLDGKVFLLVSEYSGLQAANFVSQLLGPQDRLDLIEQSGSETFLRLKKS